MIILNTPIIIYPDTYDAQFLVRVEIELRTQTLTLYLGPARTTEDNIFIAVKETVGEETKVKYSELLRTMTLQQNIENPDPVISALLEKYVDLLSDIEQIIVANQHDPGGLATVPKQIGTTEWSLESTWAPNGEREVAIEDLGTAPTKGARKGG